MESDRNFFLRRAIQERAAAARAVTNAAKERRLFLASVFESKLREIDEPNSAAETVVL